jgi:hypothetical protein
MINREQGDIAQRSEAPIFQYASTPAEGIRASPIDKLHFESPPDENDDANEAIGACGELNAKLASGRLRT